MYPGWSIVYPSEWDDQRFPFEDMPGTIRRPPFGATLARSPMGLLFDHVCGTPEEMANGASVPLDPPQPIGGLGLPLCCDPPKRVGGGSGSGGVADFHVAQMSRRSGSASAGQATYVVVRNTTRGGSASGGKADYVVHPMTTRGGSATGGRADFTVEEMTGERVYLVAGGDVFSLATTTTGTVECWGGGGGGQDNYGAGGGGAGGGGGYARSFRTFVASVDYPVNVAPGGGNGVAAGGYGGDSWFNVVDVIGRGGSGANVGGGGFGGYGGGSAAQGTPNVGDVTHQGGKGVDAPGLHGSFGGGGGGSSGGYFQDGIDGAGNFGAAAVFDGAPGSNGGLVFNGDGVNADQPGGGAGGGGGGASIGGIGGLGKVRVRWFV